MAFRAGSALAAFAAATLVSTAVAAQDETPLRVTGNVTTIELAPVLLAIDQGLYDGPVTLNNGGVPNLFGLAAPATDGTPVIADVSTNAETQALRVSADNPDLRIVMTVSEGLYRIIGSRAAGVETLSDLKGKRVGSIANTSSNFFLREMLRTVGLTMDDITLVPLFPMDLYKTAFADMTVDAITIWEPGAEYAAEALGEDAVEFSGEGVYRELFNLNTTRQALEDPAMRAKIVEFVAALIEASEMLAQDPARAQDLVAASANYRLEDVRTTWKHHAYPAILVPDLLDVLVEEEGWLAAMAGRTPRTREELATLVDPSVLEEARALLESR
jgi:NitT/TauT family transport system substrate-binding protein